jgi:hypothetical protein
MLKNEIGDFYILDWFVRERENFWKKGVMDGRRGDMRYDGFNLM